jgi:pterin-4a-carbinolamine dehydratase
VEKGDKMIKKILKGAGTLLAAGMYLSGCAAGVTSDEDYRTLKDFDVLLDDVVSDGKLTGSEILKIYNVTSAVPYTKLLEDIENNVPSALFLSNIEPIIDIYKKEFGPDNDITLTPEHQDYILQELEKMNISSLDLDEDLKTRLDLRMHKIQSKLASNESLSLQDAISLQEIIKNDRLLNEKRKIEGMRAINKAAEADIQKFSKFYQTYAFLAEEGWVSKQATTDDAIRDYLQQQKLTLEVRDIGEIPHRDAKFASLYATAASSILTGLFAYYATRDKNVAVIPGIVFISEFMYCDFFLDSAFPTSTLVYYLSSGIRAAVPAVAGLYALNSLIEGRKTGQNTNVKIAPSKKKEKEGRKKRSFRMSGSKSQKMGKMKKFQMFGRR